MVYGQLNRTQLKGTLVSNSTESLAGITVMNIVSLEGTITNDKGAFFIQAMPGDKLNFRAVQFTNFTLEITKEMMTDTNPVIRLREGINELEEVRISNGEVMIPVKRIVQVDSKVDLVSDYNLNTAAVDRIEYTFSDKIRQPEDYEIRNEAYQQSQPRFNMFNLVGTLLYFVSGVVTESIDLDGGRRYQQNEEEFNALVLKEKYNAAYLIDILGIEEAYLYDFMYFAKDNGLNDSYFEPEKELDLIQFLQETAILYKNRKE